jgi:trehalose 2-sulfotransferase
MTTYLVCATPRSGSTLLCETLADTGVAGNPLEFFEALPETGMPRRPLDYLRGLEDTAALAMIERAPPHTAPEYSDVRAYADYAEHLDRVRDWGTTANGVWGAKIMWAHLEDLARRLEADDVQALVDDVFDRPRLIWVRRQDTVRQAVSLWRAMQTQSWRAENQPGAGEPQYSFAALRHLVELLAAQDAAWERFFAPRAADVLTVTYDELDADLRGVLERTLAHIGVTAPADALAAVPKLRRQADERSDTWAAAYERDDVLAPR